MSRRWPGILLVGVLTLTGAGCSGSEESPGPVGSTAAAAASGLDAARQCIRDRGWEIVEESDGFSSPPGIPASQFDIYTADSEECLALYVPPVPASAVSDARWEEFYAEVVESAECLRGEGVDVPDTPSFQALKDSYLTADGAEQWGPWGFVPVTSMDSNETRALEKTCPQVLL